MSYIGSYAPSIACPLHTRPINGKFLQMPQASEAAQIAYPSDPFLLLGKVARGQMSLAELQASQAAGSPLGLEARNFENDNPEWASHSFDWAQRALEAAGAENIPELRGSRHSGQAFRRLQKAGKLDFGTPPPGALVFAPKPNGRYRLGFANPDGTSFRSTVSKKRRQTPIGDRPLPEGAGWLKPQPSSRNDGKIDAKKIHMTQVYDRRYNRSGKPTSGDCVPTSLTMGLKALGKAPKGGSVQGKIDQVRLRMARGAAPERDGVDANGRRSSAEHAKGMFLEDVRRGARRSGVRTRNVSNVQGVAREVRRGNPVVLFGGNAGKVYGRQSGISFNGNHAILVSGYNEKTGKFTINDPLSHRGPFQVTRKQLAAFQGRADGVDGMALQR